MSTKTFGFFLGLAIFLYAVPSYAHPGRTAGDGCHYCRTNCDKWGVPWNERHCHGGGGSSSSSSKPASTTTSAQAVPVATPVPTPKAEEKNLCSGKTSCTATVDKVIDGDTITLDTGEKVRYIGIDTPETVDPKRPVGCFGKEASDKNKELVEGKEVKLKKDVSEKDKYGRLLRYVYVNDSLINDLLVRDGYAYSYSYPPDIAKQDQFREAQREARESKRGLWADGVCEKEVKSVVDGEIRTMFETVGKDYAKYHQGFRESLIQDIIQLAGVNEERAAYFVYSELKDIR